MKLKTKTPEAKGKQMFQKKKKKTNYEFAAVTSLTPEESWPGGTGPACSRFQ